MNTPKNESYQKFLVGIAQRVDSLLIENSSAVGRFTKHLQSFADQENKHIEWLEKQKEKCFKKGMAFKISSDMKVPPKYESPARMFVIDCATKNYPAPKNEAEEYQRNYVILASIHDHILTQVEPIDKSILPEQSAFLIWSTLHEFWDSGPQRAFIERVFKRVQADLAGQKPATPTDSSGNDSGYIHNAPGKDGRAANDTQQAKRPQITLQQFFGDYCDLSKRPDIDSKREMLLREHRKEKEETKLPLVGKKKDYRKGQTYLFWLDELLANWTTYRKALTTLPPLKKSGNK
jgi:hypothetical protein